jgi:hypothetical protein
MPNYAQAAIQIRQKKEREAKRLERELRLSADYTALLLHPPGQVGKVGGGVFIVRCPYRHEKII